MPLSLKTPSGKLWGLLPLAIFALLAMSTLLRQPIRFPLDDAYITIANAELLLRGGADAYGNTLPTGASSPVHLFLVAALSVIMDGRWASMTLLIIAAGVYALGLWKVLLAVSMRPLLAACGTVIGLAVGDTWGQLANGLETGMAMATVVWATYFLQRRHYTAIAVLGGLMPFIRPEFSVLALCLAAYCAWDLRKTPERIVRPLVIAVVTGLVLAIVTWLTTGHIVAETAAAKAAYFDEARSNFGSRLGMAITAVRFSPLVWVLAGLALLPAVTGGWSLLAYCFAFTIFAAISLPVSLFHNDFRYLYTFVPLAIMGWVVAFARLKNLTAMMVIATLVVVGLTPNALKQYRRTADYHGKQEQVALWVEQNLPNGARILIHDAGFLAWHSKFVATPPKDLQLIDAVGLKTPSAIKYHKETTHPSQGRDRWKAVSDIARDGGAQYAVIADVGFWGDIADYLRRAGWQVDLIYPSAHHYQVFKLTPPVI